MHKRAPVFFFCFFVGLFSCHYPAWFPFDAGHSGKLRTVYPSPLEQDGTGIHLPCFPRFYLFLLLDGRRFFQISCLRPLVLRVHPLSLCVRTCVYNARPLSSQTWNFSTLTNFVVISAVERRRKGWRGRVELVCMCGACAAPAVVVISDAYRISVLCR